MAELKDWNVAAASNNSTPPDGAPEGMAPSAVNDTMREIMAVLARWKGDNDSTLDTGGSSNAYTLTPNGTYSAYARGDSFLVEANHTNTGAATLNVSSLGAKAIVKPNGDALTAGEIVSGAAILVVYDGTNFQLVAGDTTSSSLSVTDLTASGTVDFAGATVDDLGTVTTGDIDGGTVDGAVIGGNSAAAGTFTDLTASGTATLTGASVTVEAVSESSDFDQTADSVLVLDNGVLKRILLQNAGVKTVRLDAIQTFALADANTSQVLTGTTDRTWTVPANASVAFPRGTMILISCESTGQVTLSAAGGVTLNNPDSHTKVKASGSAMLLKTGTNVWHFAGQTEA